MAQTVQDEVQYMDETMVGPFQKLMMMGHASIKDGFVKLNDGLATLDHNNQASSHQTNKTLNHMCGILHQISQSLTSRNPSHHASVQDTRGIRTGIRLTEPGTRPEGEEEVKRRSEEPQTRREGHEEARGRTVERRLLGDREKRGEMQMEQSRDYSGKYEAEFYNPYESRRGEHPMLRDIFELMQSKLETREGWRDSSFQDPRDFGGRYHLKSSQFDATRFEEKDQERSPTEKIKPVKAERGRKTKQGVSEAEHRDRSRSRDHEVVKQTEHRDRDVSRSPQGSVSGSVSGSGSDKKESKRPNPKKLKKRKNQRP